MTSHNNKKDKPGGRRTPAPARASISSSQRNLGLGAPRTGNTGALVSIALIDCLEFSIHGAAWQTIVSDFLQLDPNEFARMQVGLRGYPNRVQRGHVQILWSDDHDRPVKTLISGQGMDEIGVDGLELLRHVLRWNDGALKSVKTCVSQIHLALDDRSGFVSAGLIDDCILSGCLVTRLRKARKIVGYELGSDLPQYAGETWYVGSFNGDRLVRLYDKQAERIAAGEDDPGPWYRFEVQARRKCADVLARTLAREGLGGSGGILRGIIDFREQDNNQQDRRTPFSWWMTFCDGLVPIRTGVKKVAQTLEKACRWLERSVSRRLAEVRAILGDRWLNDLIKSGEKKTDQGVISAMSREYDLSPEWLGLRRLNVDCSGYCPF